MKGTIIGIDLGTTHSLVGVFEQGMPCLLPNAHGELLTPSVVGLLEDGRIVLGAAARELAVRRPERCAASFKRLMGSDRSVSLGGRDFSAIELSSLVLKSLKEDAERALGRAVDGAVITVPAYFNEPQRRATRAAGELAGLKVLRIINEPTAAALAYGFHDRRGPGKSFLVFDLGGGTFDVTVMELFEGVLQILTTAGENFLGGEDFTQAIAEWALKCRGVEQGLSRSAPLLWARLLHEAEQAKRALSGCDTAFLRWPADDGSLGDEGLSLSRTEFARLAAPLLQRLAVPCTRALRDAELDRAALGEIILVGGATRMPLVQEWVRDYFGREALSRFNPDHVVALGAAVQAALIAEDRAVEDLIATDVCPHSLGIETARRYGPLQMEGGYYLPLIPRNSTVPCSREESVSTINSGQTEVKIKVFQGEGRRVEDNTLLGELKVSGLPPMPAGTEILIRFTYDVDGMLEVEALIPSLKRKASTVISSQNRQADPETLMKAKERLAALRFFPRDELDNLHLLHYGNRIIKELPLDVREATDELLTQFEAAMRLGDRNFFAQCRRQLLDLLVSLGRPYPGRNE
ncbi:MAG: hypothetical protein RL095_1816 [Verrucomicrobiota bacterium]